MKKRILSVLSKAPMRKGRVGPMHKQDWHATCVLLARELERDKHAMALLVTALELDGEDEMIHYHGTLRKLGICEKRILCVKEGFETMHQLKRSAEEAERHEAELTIVLVAVHLPRTKLLCRALDIKAKFLVAHGIPRPKDVLVELLLLPVYPFFFSRRFRKWFQQLANERRKNGKL